MPTVYSVSTPLREIVIITPKPMLFQTVLDIAIPSITFFLMAIVGMDMTTDDFRKVKSAPKAFIVGALGQYALPFCALLVVAILNPLPNVRDGMMLVAAAPAGGISTYYAYLARVNVALSIVLTSVSTILAAVTMPLFLQFFHAVASPEGGLYVPADVLFSRLFLLLLLPVLIGFVVRRYRPGFVARYSKPMRIIGFVALGALIVFIFYRTWSLFLQSWTHIAEAAVVFVIVSMVLGYFIGFIFRLDSANAFTLSIEFGTRNIAICTAMAVIVLHRPEFATFGAIYFLVEAALIIPIIKIYHRLVKDRSSARGLETVA